MCAASRHVVVLAPWRQHWKWPGSGCGDGVAGQMGGTVEHALWLVQVQAAGCVEGMVWQDQQLGGVRTATSFARSNQSCADLAAARSR
eukprot:6221082-Prorocentrum_lima.AAC.1